MAGRTEEMWCSACGERNPVGSTVCSRCGASLSSDESVGQGRADRDDADGADAGSLAYDLEGWTPAQRDALELLLTGREIPHDWSRAHVVVPAARADEVEDLLDGLGPEPPPPSAADEEASSGEAVQSAPGVEHRVAGPGRRLLGALVDGVLWGAMASGLSSTILRGDDATLALALTMAGVIAAYEIVSVALWGRTIGKLVAGTRVVASESGATPAWSQAVLRWAVPSIVGLALLFLEDDDLTAAVEAVVTVFVYFGILRGPLRQGVHDKVAGTVVVLALRAGGGALDRSGNRILDAAPPLP